MVVILLRGPYGAICCSCNDAGYDELGDVMTHQLKRVCTMKECKLEGKHWTPQKGHLCDRHYAIEVQKQVRKWKEEQRKK